MPFFIEEFLKKYYTPDEKIIVGCSTGADSMFLLYNILKTPYRKNLVACYFNHHTREQCQQEEEFLLALGREKGFSVEIGECDFKKIQQLYPSKSFEELAREKRYQFFDALCHIYKTDKIITAHHLDDKIETFFFNMLRGSKLTGLINMTEFSGGILRPLLHIEKKEIYQYLQENKLIYFEDETNTDSSFTRNYLRNEVLPLLDKVHPEHKKNLQNLFSYLEEVKNHLDNEVEKFLEKQPSVFRMKEGDSEENYNKIESKGEEQQKTSFSIAIFNSLSPLLQKEIIRSIYAKTNNNATIGLSESNIAEILKFINGKNNKTRKEIKNMKLFKNGDKIEY